MTVETEALWDQFFELVAPALADSIVRAKAEHGASLSEQHVHAAMLEALRRVEGDALREVFGADVAAWIDGRKSN